MRNAFHRYGQHRSLVQPKNQTGLTMIEVLITVCIISVGLLSMASMQITGIRSINSSTYRTQASILANDMAERMRANPAALAGNQFLDLNSTGLDCAAIPETYCGESHASGNTVNADSCNPSQMAAYDFNVWYCGVASNGARAGGVSEFLPNSQANVFCNDVDPPGGADADPCTDRSRHTIAISWSEQNPNGDPDQPMVTQIFTMTFQP